MSQTDILGLQSGKKTQQTLLEVALLIHQASIDRCPKQRDI